jgi:hypothetical protein
MKPETIVREYAQRLSNEDLQYLYVRLQQRLGGDLGEACDFMAQDKEMDKLLSSSNGSYDWYDRIDLTTKSVEKEMKKRSM